MRGVLSMAAQDQIEQMSCQSYGCDWALEVMPGSYVAIQYGPHRLVSTNPDVVDFLLRVQDTLRYRAYQTTDAIPTEDELSLAILGAGLPSPRRSGDLLPEIP